MLLGNPFQISEEDVERSSTLDKDDVGKWGYVMNGCINVVGSRDEAMQMVVLIREWMRGAK
jgi:hypothetical protein